MVFKGKVERFERDENGDFTILTGKSTNLWVDDGKEFALDFIFGIESWLEGDWNEERWMGYGTCMFNNESFERASGMDYIPTGQECNYPVDETWLVGPEDSFLSREIGQRTAITITRRDQTVEMSAIINVPGDVPVGTKLREFGVFLKSSGPTHDPSYHAASKSHAMICRTALAGTGYYCSGGTCLPCGSGAAGAELCYYDEPYSATGDVQLRWKFGEC